MGIGNHRLLSRLGSLVLVLCLLAAPLCATRCTLSACAGPDTQEQSATGCHHSSKPSNGSAFLAAAIAPGCLPADSLLAARPVPQARVLSANPDFHLASENVTSPASQGTPILLAFCSSNRGLSPGDSALFASSLPLRL